MPILIVIIAWGFMIVKTFTSLKKDENKNITEYLAVALVIEIGVFIFLIKWLIETYQNV